MEAKTNLPKVTITSVARSSLDSTVFTRILHRYLRIYAQMLIFRYASKRLHARHCVLNTWLPMKQRFSSFKWLQVSLCVLETCCFLQLLKTTWNTKRRMNYTEWTASQLLVFASKGCIYFTCQKTDFHSLGDILMWFKSGVDVLLGM